MIPASDVMEPSWCVIADDFPLLMFHQVISSPNGITSSVKPEEFPPSPLLLIHFSYQLQEMEMSVTGAGELWSSARCWVPTLINLSQLIVRDSFKRGLGTFVEAVQWLLSIK